MTDHQTDRLVLFFMTACRHSQNLKKCVWPYFVNNYGKTKKLLVEEVDCFKDCQAIAKQFGINLVSTPCIVLFWGGLSYVHRGQPSIQAIETFIREPDTDPGLEAISGSLDGFVNRA